MLKTPIYCNLRPRYLARHFSLARRILITPLLKMNCYTSKSLILFIIFAQGLLPPTCDSKPNRLNPVIFVPGDGGNQVDAKLNKSSVVHYICTKTTSDFFNIWLNMELLVPLVIDCWVDNMKLNYDNVSRTTSDQPGVELRIPNFGDPFSVEWIDPSRASTGGYFKDIGNALVNLGHTRNVSIRGAPYDFRKAPNENGEYFIRLKALVEETYTENGGEAVVLIAHSMGGPMCLHFLHTQTQAWKDRHVRALVALSGAWGGSAKAVKVFAVGDDLGAYFLRESVMRNVQVTMPSSAFLLPSSLFWKSDEVLVETYERNYTWSDLQDFFLDLDLPVAWEMWKDVYNYSLNFAPPGVEVHCLHGFNVNTVERLVYKKGSFPEGYPALVYGDGDGTVNARSLEGCQHWHGAQPQPVYHQPFPNMDHMQVLRDSRVIDYIVRLFDGKL